MALPLYLVDAFTSRPFGGNPAAVCLPDPAAPPSDAWMQTVAAEMNLSETAFVLPRPDGTLGLRWFTPRVEVDLCGHATLATAHVLFATGRAPAGSTIDFNTRSGLLRCSQRPDGWIRMDFPADPVRTALIPEGLEGMLGTRPLYVGRGKDYLLVEVGSEEELRNLRPHLPSLARLPFPLTIVTCEGNGEPWHFLSRCFAPAVGIAEDPVTGSAHCTLATYWAKRLKRTEFLAWQASARGGALRVILSGDRVLLEGQAVTVLEGALRV